MFSSSQTNAPKEPSVSSHKKVFAISILPTILASATFLFSIPSSPVHAEETDIQVNVPDSIALSASPTTVDIGTLAPESFGSAYTDLTVSTNSAGGYSLKIASATSTTSLVHTNGSATGHLDSITSPVTINTTGSNFPGDKWGYSVGLSSSSTSKDYKVVPASTAATEIAHKEAPTMDDVTRVNFGTRPTSGSAAGTYTGTVTFTATAKEIVKDITLLTSMQDLARHPEYCTNSAIGTTKENLSDERDPSGKKYKIRKLADGNCWMIDNIKLANVTIEPTKSNVPAGTSFNLPAAIVGSKSVAGPTWTNQAKESHVIDANSAANSNGYLYNWFAATAGAQADASDTTSSLMTASSGSAVGDICPKGWKLPDNVGSKSFYNLYNVEYPAGSGTYPYQSLANMKDTDGIYPAFVPTGYYFYDTGLVSTTESGFYWSRTVSGATRSRVMKFNTSDAYLQSTDNKGYSFAIRCVSAI